MLLPKSMNEKLKFNYVSYVSKHLNEIKTHSKFLAAVSFE